MTYILIVLVLSLTGGNAYYSNYSEHDSLPKGSFGDESRVQYQAYKDKDKLANAIGLCKDANINGNGESCQVVGVIGCDRKGCKDYNFTIKKEPEIKDTLKLIAK